jgi:hypothetical protein
MGTKCFLAKIGCTARARINEVHGRGMLLFTRAIPWLLKAFTVCAVMLRSYSGGGAAPRPERVLAAVAFATLTGVLPSILFSVTDRAATTAYVIQSALFLGGTHASLLALDMSGFPHYQVAVAQTCMLHMLWSQWLALDRYKQVLVYQSAVRALVALVALMSWAAFALMLPRISVDMLALCGLMFVGEVLGVAVCFVAAVILAVGDTIEAFLTERA